MNHIGLDWGTNYISVGFQPPGKKEPIAAKFRDNGKEKIPSLVYYSEYDTLVGEQVQSHLEQISRYLPEDRLKFHQGVVRSLKRNLNPSGAHMVPGKGLVSHLDIVRDTFAYVKKDIEAGCFEDKAVDKVTLTHPVVCTEAYKKMIETAALNSGFKEVELLEEPIAAAMGYASRGADVGRGILVYDFGGGTFDVAFVLKEEDHFRIPIPSMGDPMCGGDDLDIRLYEYWNRKAQEALGRPITDKPGEIDTGFLFRCRYQKETLSRIPKMEFIEYLPDINGSSDPTNNRLSLVLEQNTLNQMFGQLISRTVEITGTMLKKVEQAGYKVDTVILIGGASKWPLVKELLKEMLPVTPIETMDVDVAVAMGAAWKAAPEPCPMPKPQPKEDVEKVSPDPDTEFNDQGEQNSNPDQHVSGTNTDISVPLRIIWTLGKAYSIIGGVLEDGIKSLAFSPDGKLLASAKFPSGVDIWEVSTSHKLKHLVTPDHGIDFSPDGKYLATCGQYCRADLWRVSDWRNTHLPDAQLNRLLPTAY
nr:Hsp70 family protein [uncultured Desulfobacter sp.]